MSAGTLKLALGPARLELRPLWPWQWRPLARRYDAKPARLCLELLALGAVAWQGVAESGPRPGPEDLARLPAAALEPLLAALCAPWPGQEEEAGMRALEEYLGFLADYPGLDCAACREQEERGEGEPDCAACPLPAPPAEAEAALALYPLLADLPPAAAPLVQGWLDSLSPGEQRRLALHLALLHRWHQRQSQPRGGRGGRGGRGALSSRGEAC